MNTRKINNSVIRKALGVALSVALVLPLTACGASSTSSNSTDTSNSAGSSETAESSDGKNTATELHVAYQPIVGNIPLFILKDENLIESALKDKGYDVKVTYTEFESGPPENEAFASQNVDLGNMGDVPALSGIAAGQKRSLIGISYNGEQIHSVLVKTDSDISTVSDLKGKKIGVVIGSSAQCFLSGLLNKNGLSLSDVETVNISPGEQEAALSNGEVDAVAVWEPIPSRIVSDGVGKVLADGTGVYESDAPIIINDDYLDANPEIVKIFIDVYKEAVQKLQDDKETYIAKYADTLGLSKDVLTTALSKASFPIDISDENISEIQKTADFLKENDLITTELNVKDYIVTEIN